jgi:carbon storage regulator
MLVLSRQRNESIMIGDDVEITIVDVRGDKVRLGITAPRTISVHRKEVYLAIQQEKAGQKPVKNQDETPTS